MAGLRLLSKFADGYIKLSTSLTGKILGSTAADISEDLECCCDPGECCCCQPRLLDRYTLNIETTISDVFPETIDVSSNTITSCDPDGSKVCCCNKWEVWQTTTRPYYRGGNYPRLGKTGSIKLIGEKCVIERKDLPEFHLGLKDYQADYELWVMCDSLTACCDVNYNNPDTRAGRTPDSYKSRCCGNPCCVECGSKWKSPNCDECRLYEEEKRLALLRRGECFSYNCNGKELKKPEGCEEL